MTFRTDEPVDVPLKLKQYRCHKEVKAAKIVDMRSGPPTANDPTGCISLRLLTDCGLVTVTSDFVRKHQPKVRGYYVRYEDGYESFSPEQAFVDGYSEIKTDATTQTPILTYFSWTHLQIRLALPAKLCAELAFAIDALLPNSAEKTAGLRKLLEAKDCFVRALL